MRAWCEVDKDTTKPGSWHLESLGSPLPLHLHNALVRSALEVPVGDGYAAFLDFLGYRRKFEYVQRGWIFQHGAIEVSLYRVWPVREPGNLSSLEEPGPEARWVAEARAVATDVTQAATEDALISFARSVESVVQFTKLSV